MLRSLAASSLLLLLAAPAAQAEFGPMGEDGWPVAVDGTSTNPFPGVHADDVEALLSGTAARPPLNQAAGGTVYPYWPLLTAEMLRLEMEFPDLVRLHTAGRSTLGLDLYMLEICDFATSGEDCAPPDNHARREVLWVDGGHHSNEYSGVYFALAFAQFLIEEYASNETARWIVDNRHTFIMPMVNPDGSHAMGRLNAMGVNLNRNYPVVWDGVGHDPLLNNRGPSPASEVETQVNIEWFNRTRADYYASVHCCGNLWLYPYGEEGIDPIDDPMLRQVCLRAFPSVGEACGPIWSTIYPASGSSVDTAYEYAGMVAFGYEMSGRGAVSLWGQPLTFESVRVQEIESWNGVLHAALNVHRYGAYPVLAELAADGSGVIATVRNDGWGNLAGATIALQWPDGGSSEAVLPTLGPGEEATLRLPCEMDGLHQIVLDYPKRLVATTNWGSITQDVFVQSPGQAAAPDVAPAADFFVQRSEPVAEEESPGPLALVVVAVLLGLAMLLRRRD